MRKIAVLILAAAAIAAALDISEAYRLANENFSKRNKGLALNVALTPHWINGSDFWYEKQTPQGKLFMFVSPENGLKESAFDHAALAALLAGLSEKEVDADNLPLESVKFQSRGEFTFTAFGRHYCFSGNALSDITPEEDTAVGHNGNDRREERQSGQLSPDGKWLAIQREHNVWLRNTETRAEHQATFDGEPFYSYGSSVPGPREVSDEDFERGAESFEYKFSGSWSPDSKHFAFCRLDIRKAGWLHIVKNVPADSMRPKLYSLVYPMGADENVPMLEPYVCEPGGKAIRCEAEPEPALFYNLTLDLDWDADSKHFTYTARPRSGKVERLLEIDAATGKSRVLNEERSETTVNPTITVMRKLGGEILISSERSGWNNLYLIDRSTGKTTQLTKGPFFAKDIFAVNEAERFAIVGAGCREAGDPYYRYVYRVPFDGSGASLLTPIQGNHRAKFSPDGRFFIDEVSRVDMPQKFCVSDLTGQKLLDLEQADISALLANGWRSPIDFCAKAADGETDIYATVYLPKTIEEGRKYPVLEHVYTGPQGFYARKHFQPWDWMEVYNELGFVVVAIDPRGTGCRSKAFRDHSFENLGDGGIDDRIAAMKQMAERWPFMDLERVGVFGGSAGGYDAARALLIRPEFYDTAVSVSGNHDHRNDKAWWTEAWMGFPDHGQYAEQSNLAAAKNLRGNLLLIHGDMDDNVHVSATLQLADSLIKANKDFDMIIAPNSGHGCTEAYYERRRWDYFTRHLLGESPPKEFKLGL
jgi:dipeptidyl aminopeptidase/acylaminoacyl peptidase